MSVAERQHDGERRVWSGERGALGFVRLRDDVALIVLDGKLDDAAATAWNEHFPWLVGDAKLALFLDGAAVSFAGASFIAAGTASVARIRSRINRLEVLVGGGLIEMIAKTANVTLGGVMQISRDRSHFESSLQRLLV